ncbi:MAG TPA: HupE/UreJ family protein [Variovorax sp.]|nr:HupE/UreJ family protein [Variovorax sp.]
MLESTHFDHPGHLRARLLRRAVACALALLLAALAAGPRTAHAHKASDAYLLLQIDGDALALRWDIALRDLDTALDLDRDGNRQLSWGEVSARIDEIRAYALARLTLQQAHCTLAQARPPAVDDRIDGAYLVLQLEARCELGAGLEVDYRLMREIDPTHRGLLRVEGLAEPGQSSLLRVLSLDPSGGPVTLASSPQRSLFRDGVHHILIGYDHVLFLLSLLLPSVLRRNGPGAWAPVLTWREAVWPMLGIVTMFTVAHSLTLALAALHVVNVPPRIIEPAIALTIVLAALDNIRPWLLRGRRRLFGFLFGLIHGFGFAGALAELELPSRDFALALLQFNLGVEAGQLAVVFIALGALLALRHWTRYQSVLLKGGSAVAAMLASVWLVERVFDLQVLPFS